MHINVKYYLNKWLRKLFNDSSKPLCIASVKEYSLK